MIRIIPQDICQVTAATINSGPITYNRRTKNMTLVTNTNNQESKNSVLAVAQIDSLIPMASPRYQISEMIQRTYLPYEDYILSEDDIE